GRYLPGCLDAWCRAVSLRREGGSAGRDELAAIQTGCGEPRRSEPERRLGLAQRPTRRRQGQRRGSVSGTTRERTQHLGDWLHALHALGAVWRIERSLYPLANVEPRASRDVGPDDAVPDAGHDEQLPLRQLADDHLGL